MIVSLVVVLSTVGPVIAGCRALAWARNCSAERGGLQFCVFADHYWVEPGGEHSNDRSGRHDDEYDHRRGCQRQVFVVGL